MRTHHQLTRRLLVLAACLGLAAIPPAPPAAAQPDEVTDSTMARADAAFNRGAFDEAADLYQQALAEGADHAFLHFRLGYALHVTGHVEQALAHHLRGIATNNRPIRIDCIYNAACAHALLGHTDDAIRYFQYAVDAGFTDKRQLAGDTDLDSIRDDPRFIAIADGIGTEPTLFKQLDFMVGRWSVRSEDGSTLHQRFERPSDLSAAITYEVTRPGQLAWIGSMVPIPLERTWQLTYCNHIGTTYRFTGAYRDGSVVFEGRGEDVGGQGVHVRVTYSPGDSDTLIEHAEVSTDGDTWRLHHEVTLTRDPDNAAAQPADTEP